MTTSPAKLTVLYDARCPLCVRCRSWMVGQPAYVPLEFLACDSAEAKQRYAELPWLGAELVVVGDGGEVWVGPAAFLVALWALPAWREWSYRLSGPLFAPLAERFFHLVSRRRRNLGAWFDHAGCPEGHCRPASPHAPPFR
jgi:predicted DCC family thiol-disulfide oxidoreductase YuxK